MINLEVVRLPCSEIAPCARDGIHHVLLLIRVDVHGHIQDECVLLRIGLHAPSENASIVRHRLGYRRLDLIGKRDTRIQPRGLQRTRKRDQAVLADEQQIALVLREAAPADGRAEPPLPDQRPRRGRGWIGTAKYEHIAVRRNEYGQIIDAVACINRPRIHRHQVAAVRREGREVERIRSARNGLRRQIPRLKRVLLDEPCAVFVRIDRDEG